MQFMSVCLLVSTFCQVKYLLKLISEMEKWMIVHN